MSVSRVIYLSLDGILEPLGESQVLRYLERLASGGNVEFTLLTFEKSADLAGPRLQEMKKRAHCSGIRWEWAAYSGGFSSTPTNTGWFVDQILRFATANAVVWARGYIPAIAARIAQGLIGTSYVFDTRGYWFDERRDAGGALAHPVAYGAAKLLEKSLYGNASAIVGLTNLVVEDVEGGVFGPNSCKHVSCITTCADYEVFSEAEIAPELAERTNGSGGPVMGYIGSFNVSYEIDATFSLANLVISRNPRALFVVLTRQTETAATLIEKFGIPSQNVLVTTVTHTQIASWLAGIDFGFLLCRESFAKRASMPTKLAEFFASGVRPVAAPLNQDMERWIRYAGSGKILRGTSFNEIKRVADWMLESHDDRDIKVARARTRGHFDLSAGVEECRAIIQAVATTNE